MRKTIQAERTLMIYISLYNVLEIWDIQTIWCRLINMNVVMFLPMRCNRKPIWRFWPATQEWWWRYWKGWIYMYDLKQKELMEVWYPEMRIDLCYPFFFSLLFSYFLFSLPTCQVVRGGGVATHPKKLEDEYNHSFIIAN